MQRIDAVIDEELADEEAELIVGPRDVRREPPVTPQLLGLVHAERRFRVADIADENHASSASRMVPTRCSSV